MDYNNIEELKNINEAIASKKELDAIWSIYYRTFNRCNVKISNKCGEYSIDRGSKAAVIMYIIEEYFRILDNPEEFIREQRYKKLKKLLK